MPPLTILPGRLLVTFLLRLGDRRGALVVEPRGFLDGLRAARAMLSFAELCRDEDRPEELLPWAGNV
jgi:hypothetical protein